jgi:hypothetical protein
LEGPFNPKVVVSVDGGETPPSPTGPAPFDPPSPLLLDPASAALPDDELAAEEVVLLDGPADPELPPPDEPVAELPPAVPDADEAPDETASLLDEAPRPAPLSFELEPPADPAPESGGDTDVPEEQAPIATPPKATRVPTRCRESRPFLPLAPHARELDNVSFDRVMSQIFPGDVKESPGPRPTVPSRAVVVI